MKLEQVLVEYDDRSKHEQWTDVDTTYGRNKKINADTSKLNHYSNNPNHKVKELGRGAEAVVYHKNHESWQGTVKKWLKNEDADVTKCGVILYLIQGDKAENIHAPKVYDIKQIKTPLNIDEDRCDYLITMEKLTPLSSIDPQILPAVFGSILETHEELSIIGRDAFTACVKIRQAVIAGQDSLKLGSKSFPFNQSFRQLQTIIMDSFHKSSGNPKVDIHDDNVMVRLTKFGPQLVISDPIYAKVIA
jgi:hypothetical protein